jgi:hypothetical protein
VDRRRRAQAAPGRILADGSWLPRLDPEGRTGQPVVARVLE